MVRLKHKIYVIRLNSEKKSQFHYGSIKTFYAKRDFLALCTGLNSTMVRLKLLITKLLKVLNLCLNSTMVRLKLHHE